MRTSHTSLSSRLPQFTSTEFINSGPIYFTKSTSIICRCGQHVASNITPDSCSHCISIRTAARMYDESHPTKTRTRTATFTVDTLENVNIINCLTAKTIDPLPKIKASSSLPTVNHHVSVGINDVKCSLFGCQERLNPRYEVTCCRCESEAILRSNLECLFGDINTDVVFKIELSVVATNCGDQMCGNYRDCDAKAGIVNFKHVIYLPAFQNGIDQYHAVMSSLYTGYDKDMLSTLDCVSNVIDYDYNVLRFYLNEIKMYSHISNDVTCDCDNMQISPETISIIRANSELSTLRFDDYLEATSSSTVQELNSYYY